MVVEMYGNREPSLTHMLYIDAVSLFVSLQAQVPGESVELLVQCREKRGMLHVASETVKYGNMVMSAVIFETFAGNLRAGKWRESLR